MRLSQNVDIFWKIGLDWIGLDPQGAMPDSASAKNLWASSWARAHGPRPKAELGLPMGRAKYGLLCNEEGGIIDDGIVYRLEEDRYMLVANASNKEEVHRWLLPIGRHQGNAWLRARLQNIYR